MTDYDTSCGVPESVSSILTGHNVGTKSNDRCMPNYQRNVGQTAEHIIKSAWVIHGNGTLRWDDPIERELVELAMGHLAQHGIQHPSDTQFLHEVTHGARRHPTAQGPLCAQMIVYIHEPKLTNTHRIRHSPLRQNFKWFPTCSAGSASTIPTLGPTAAAADNPAGCHGATEFAV